MSVLPGNARTYHNPILFADYSDPDVVRVGSDYYLVASSFHFSPGIPVLESHDLVHWTILGHALARLDFAPAYDLPGPVNFTDATGHPKLDYALGYRYASGVWAPAIRAHAGRLFIYFPTPTEGIFMTSAPRAVGPWTPPVQVIGQPRLEDPCPFWDDDGHAYLIHSREGAGPLILHRMSPDGRRVLDAGKVIVDDPVHLPTLEGPKLYKRDGYYYIFAPYGGVDHGSEAVLRARNIYGPYEFRTVLSQGATQVQGPHQGGYVETPSGQGWFLHFNSTGPYGRILYLEPVRWKDGWPIVGELRLGATVGQPVQSHRAPDVGRTFRAVHPQTSDEFTSRTLGPQWQWNHNPAGGHWSLTERPALSRVCRGRRADARSIARQGGSRYAGNAGLAGVRRAEEARSVVRDSAPAGQRRERAVFLQPRRWAHVPDSRNPGGHALQLVASRASRALHLQYRSARRPGGGAPISTGCGSGSFNRTSP